MRALIVEGDKNKLREFLSVTSSPHAEGRTLHSLVIAYLELDKLKEAKRVLQVHSTSALKLKSATPL